MSDQRAELLVVRHGESVWDAEGRWAGHADVELPVEGLAETAEAASWPTAVCASWRARR